ncbi:MAG: DEAD/DEAH box helicase [Actinomycetota bacterium]|nr:DEAD/DEAH box helicase [Actinomycetota bacterium]
MALVDTTAPSFAGAGSELPANGRADVDLTAFGPLLDRLERRQPVDDALSGLVDGALGVWSRPGFDTFVSLPRLHFEPFAHQLQTAARVLRGMQGRAILADEVGLGKTIEAVLVLSELRLRGLAGRALILVPAGLVEQWQEELDRKFALASTVAQGRGWSAPEGAGDHPVVIASIASARRPPLQDALTATQWDVVVVDEAHRVRNPRRASGRLVRALRARHLLLLTATPIENRLSDVFDLVSLVRPGHLGTPAEFRRRHGRGEEADLARDVAALRALLSQVMVRHRRSEVALMLPRRLAHTHRVMPHAQEAALYRSVAERVRIEGRDATPARAMALRSVARLAGSSPPALAAGLEKQGWDDLAEQARRLPPTEKAAALMEVLGRHRERGEKVVVFTAFHHTLDFLVDLIAGAGTTVARYHGSLGRREKEAAIALFRDEADVLVTTEAAGEGRNLQFCHAMVNFDLPWNPMKIEQRLGRIHRIGQDHDVDVTNLVSRGTIEERVLGLLEAKINLFELVVGELDMILGRVDDDLDFESFVFNAHVASRDDEEFTVRMEAFGDDLARARGEHLGGRGRNDALVDGEATH